MLKSSVGSNQTKEGRGGSQTAATAASAEETTSGVPTSKVWSNFEVNLHLVSLSCFKSLHLCVQAGEEEVYKKSNSQVSCAAAAPEKTPPSYHQSKVGGIIWYDIFPMVHITRDHLAGAELGSLDCQASSYGESSLKDNLNYTPVLKLVMTQVSGSWRYQACQRWHPSAHSCW